MLLKPKSSNNIIFKYADDTNLLVSEIAGVGLCEEFIYRCSELGANQYQTVNDGVAHSKNPRKCAYHVTFDFDLDLEHTLDAC